MVARTTRGEETSAQRPQSSTASTPKALAARITVPTFPGSCTSSSRMAVSARAGAAMRGSSTLNTGPGLLATGEA